MTTVTYLEHIKSAQEALANAEDSTNPNLLVAFAQAHALVAIALLLEEHLANAPETPIQTVRIVGGWPPKGA